MYKISDESEFRPDQTTDRDRARGRLGCNSRPRGQNFALNWAQGEVGDCLKNIYIYIYIFIYSF